MPKQRENIVIHRLWTMPCCTASVLAIIFATSSIAADSPKGWERFEFVGNTVFSDKQLRTALVAEPDFLLATHPFSDRATVGPIAERLLFAGYRNSGFQSPQIEFQVADHGGGTVTIHEGPRFRCGQVQIRGTHRLDIDRLTDRLTQHYAKSDSFPTFFEHHGKTITRWVDPKGKLVQLEKPVWPLGTFVKFDSEADLRKKVSAALADLGFSNAKTQVTVSSNDSELTAELTVDILEEGPNDTADVFYVVGTQTNSPNDVLSFLKLTSGVVVDQTLIQSITKQLWECGRFKKHNVHFDRDENGQGRLNIELTDVKGMPALDEPLSEAAIVFMRARSWLNSVNERDMDISLTFRENGLELEVVQSQYGFILQLRNSDNLEPALASRPVVDLSLMFDDSFVTFVNSQSKSKWQASVGQFEGKVRLETNFSVAEDDERFSMVNLSASSNSRRSKDEAPFLSTLNLSPADWSGFAYKKQLQTEFNDGKLQVVRESDYLEIDVETGQIYRWDSDVAQMRIEAERFTRLKNEIVSHGDVKTNDYDAARPVSTLLSHLFNSDNWATIREVWQTQYEDLKPFEQSLAAAITKLIDGDLLRPLDAFAVFTANDHGDDQFEIPYKQPENFELTKIAGQVVGKYGLKCAPAIFAEDTWPMKVTREACLVMVDRGKYAGQVLKELQADDSNGPLCDASVAYLLSWVNQPLASTFAQRSLTRFNPESFQSDRAILMSGPSGKWMSSVIAACESLSDDEIESLRAIGLSDRLVTGLYAIQKQGQSNENSYWYQIARHGVESVLSGIVQR